MGEEEAAALDDAVGEGEAEVRGEELLDVRAADVDSLLDLGDAEDLHGERVSSWSPSARRFETGRTWTERKRARWRAAMSW